MTFQRLQVTNRNDKVETTLTAARRPIWEHKEK